MPDNALALQIQAPQIQAFNPLQAMLVASQIRSAQNQDQLAQLGIAEKTTQANALANFRARQAANDPNADQALQGSPDLMSQLFEARSKMEIAKRASFDNTILANARDAQAVMDAPAEQRETLWKEKLDAALKDRRINTLEHARLSSAPPDPTMLQNIMRSGLTLQQRIELEQKEKDRDLGRDIVTRLTPALTGGAPGTTAANPLVRSESGGNPLTVNQFGYAGKYQFGAPRLADLGIYTPGKDEDLKGWSSSARDASGKWSGTFSIPGFPEVKTLEDFRRNQNAQDAAYAIQRDRAAAEIKANGFDSYVGKTVGGVPITAEGLQNMIHLGGVDSTRKALESDGKINRKDANGTSVLDYARMGANARPAGGGGALPTSSDPDAERMIAMLPQLRIMRMSPGIPEAVAKGLDETIKHFEKANEPTSDIKNYNLEVAQARAEGKTPPKFEDWLEKSERRKSQQVSVNTFQNPILKGVTDQFIDDRDKARAAANDIRAIHLAREQVDQGIIAGAGADWRLYANKIGSFFGIPNEKITSTETFSSQIGQRVVNIIKAFGAGAGISNADRDYAAKMAGGDVKLDETSIRRILDIGERANRALIDRYNKSATKMQGVLEGDAKPYGALLAIDLPEEYKKPAAEGGAGDVPPPAGFRRVN